MSSDEMVMSMAQRPSSLKYLNGAGISSLYIPSRLRNFISDLEFPIFCQTLKQLSLNVGERAVSASQMEIGLSVRLDIVWDVAVEPLADGAHTESCGGRVTASTTFKGKWREKKNSKIDCMSGYRKICSQRQLYHMTIN